MKRTGASPLPIARREVAIVLVSHGVLLAPPLPLISNVRRPSPSPSPRLTRKELLREHRLVPPGRRRVRRR
jgi:hypothetical protein